MWYNMDDIKRANANIEHHWFDPGSMRFFHTRVGECIYHVGERSLFVTSECREPGETPRRYTIREAQADGSIDTIGEFQGYATRARAIAEIRKLQREAGTV